MKKLILILILVSGNAWADSCKRVMDLNPYRDYGDTEIFSCCYRGKEYLTKHYSDTSLTATGDKCNY